MIKGTSRPSSATSFKETAFGIIPRNQILQLEIQGTKQGLEYIYNLVLRSKEIEITPELICKIHAVSFKWIFPDWAGRFRTIQVTYSGKEAPNYFQIPELIKNLCEDLKTQLKNLPDPLNSTYIDRVVSLLTWFQHLFVFIHPFQDYNGRVARMLTVLIQLKLGLPATEIFVETKTDREKYLTAMKAGDQGDLSQLAKLISHSLEEKLLLNE